MKKSTCGKFTRNAKSIKHHLNQLRFKESCRRVEESNKFIFKRFFKYLKSRYYEKQSDVKQQIYLDLFSGEFDEHEFEIMFEGDSRRKHKNSEKFSYKKR